MSGQIAVIGECMIEIKPASIGDRATVATLQANIGYGGDTLNTSVYLARMGIDVAYVTALGDDPMSDWMLSHWHNEGIRCDLVSRVDNSVPGLYLIDIDDAGERSFYYWRDQAPARRIFDDADISGRLFKKLKTFDHIYLSGITLALYTAPVRDRLYGFLDEYRAQGGKVCFDNNYRPRQWREPRDAQHAFEQLYRRCDIAMPTIDDERLLYGDASEHDIIARIRSYGAPEIVLKEGASGCRLATNDLDMHVDALTVATVTDSTAAGDSFNAGYLAARFNGLSCPQAAARGSQLAALVVQHPGAIIPKEAMPF